jgi:hypothetical protein
LKSALYKHRNHAVTYCSSKFLETSTQPPTTEDPCYMPGVEYPPTDLIGDCFCDDLLNIEEYNYDKGDCCLTNPGYDKLCRECECKQEVTPQDKCMVEIGTQPPLTGSTYPNFMRNHGDALIRQRRLATSTPIPCTSPPSPSPTTTITTTSRTTTSTTTTTTTTTEEPCFMPVVSTPYPVYPWTIGDCTCDDNNNIEEYNYDDGDCCLTNHLYAQWCNECECKQDVTPLEKCILATTQPPIWGVETTPQMGLPYTGYKM